MSVRRFAVAAASGAVVLAAAMPALAHVGIGPTSGFDAGLAHPMSGADHALAMVAVGMIGATLGGRALWAVPLSFVSCMIVGGILGMLQMPMPLVEAGILASVVVLGGMVALGRSVPLVVACGAAALFALFHGHAHGTEMPETASGLSYGAGFVLATVLMHAFGIVAGLGIGRLASRGGAMMNRLAGGAIAALGLVMIAG
ncbi:HupE/UreJ family protein [Inquilinus sp.]|jgi:urease accessory protein|uniref:HupE/UreJ family protein n=1 Tax=Inquilinus sp. TaxID=1932117 RepID=UPI003783B3B5